jgi:hypothetical protein
LCLARQLAGNHWCCPLNADVRKFLTFVKPPKLSEGL